MWKDCDLQHWLGMTAADWLLTCALGMTVVLYFCPDAAADFTLASGAICLGTMGFVVGWRHDRECSDATNLLILVSFPVGYLLCVMLVVLHFLCAGAGLPV